MPRAPSTGDLDRMVAAELDSQVAGPPPVNRMGVTVTVRRKVRKGDTPSLLARGIYKDRRNGR